MKNSIYITNCIGKFDCNKLCESLRNVDGVLRNAKTPYGNEQIFNHPVHGIKILELADYWRKAGYLENDSVQYINYFPKTHFDNSYVTILSNLLSCSPIRIWISSIKPGKCVPWHYDIEEKEDEYYKLGTVVRYSIFIDKPSIGKIFILNDEVFHLIEQGSIYKWHNWKEYHLGFNCGNTTKYLLHYIGIQH